MTLLALNLYTPTSTAPAPASAPVTSQPRDLHDSPCVVVNRSKMIPRRCQLSRACSGSSGTTAAGRFQPNRILLFPHPSAHRRLGSDTSPAAHKARAVPPVEISSTPCSESPLARSTSYASLDRSFARIECVYICTIERAYAHAYTCYMRMHLYPHEFAFVYMGWLRCCLNFALLRSAILCIRGSRSSKHHPYHEANINLAPEEGRLAPDSE